MAIYTWPCLVIVNIITCLYLNLNFPMDQALVSKIENVRIIILKLQYYLQLLYYPYVYWRKNPAPIIGLNCSQIRFLVLWNIIVKYISYQLLTQKNCFQNILNLFKNFLGVYLRRSDCSRMLKFCWIISTIYSIIVFGFSINNIPLH